MSTTLTPITVGSFQTEYPSISADGNLVVFSSFDRGAAVYQGMIYNVVAGTATSFAPDNAEGYISADGRSVAYYSSSDGESHVLNLATGSSTLVSVNNAGVAANSRTGPASISGDGSVVAFESDASNLPGVGDGATNEAYIHVASTAKTILISQTAAGVAAGANYLGQPGQTAPGAVSQDGGTVVFSSDSQNLDPRLSSADLREVYVNSAAGAALRLVSVTQAGVVADGSSATGSISGDGTLVAFESNADNLGTDGSNYEIYVKNLVTGTLTLVSSRGDGTAAGGGSSYDPTISNDGRYVAFESTASNLPGANGKFQIYIKNLQTGALALISQAGGAPGNGGSYISFPATGRFSADDTSFVFITSATNLVGANPNGVVILAKSTVPSLALAPVAGDSVVNAAEAAAPLAITGSSDAIGGTVTVSLDTGANVIGTATVAADGSFSVPLNGAALPQGVHTVLATVQGASYLSNSGSEGFTVATVAPATAFNPVPTFSSATNVTMTGTVADAYAVTGVEIFEAGTDLGAATLNGDGTFTFTHDFAAGFHNGLTARTTDAVGNVSLVPTNFDVTTGIKHEPYAASLDNYSPTGTFLGQTEFSKTGGAYLHYFYSVSADGHETYDYESGSVFAKLKYSAYQDIFTASGDIGTESFTNKNGTHSTTLYAAGEVAAAQGFDAFTAAGKRETFVFDPGFGQDTVSGFHAEGAGHDTLSLSSTAFASIAQVLARTHDGADGAVINAGQGDRITLEGVTKAELQSNKHDFVLHA